jgi:hypothetical protein
MGEALAVSKTSSSANLVSTATSRCPGASVPGFFMSCFGPHSRCAYGLGPT